MESTRVCWPEAGRAILEPFTPPELGPGEVLIRTECSLISPGTERAFFLALPNTTGRFPSYPGYCNVGRVVETGPGVEEPRVGERVASAGGHASHVRARAAQCWKVPEGLAAEEAVYFNLAGIALQGVRKARPELGEATLVVGLGLIGNLALQCARLQGAVPVLGVDPDAGRREVALRSGADACSEPAAELAEWITEQAGSAGPAVVIEATGFPEAVNDAFLYAGHHARVVLLASTRGETQTNFYRDVHKKGLTVLGAHAHVRPASESSPGYWTMADDTRTVLRLLGAGRLSVQPLTSEVLPASEAPRAYEWLASWRKDLLGVVLRWSDESI